MNELGPNQPPDEFEKTLNTFQDMGLNLPDVLFKAGFEGGWKDLTQEFVTLRLAYIGGKTDPEQNVRYGLMMFALKVAVETARSKPK